uniref:RNA-dependent RNA polymerase n=1 Tax=Patollo virus TaxID=2800935 RepID=A0A894KGT5_9VIRU|nr:MAG: RNA-dependent RNA polymerase [Patollo virus]
MAGVRMRSKRSAGSAKAELLLILTNLAEAVRCASSLVGLTPPALPLLSCVGEVKEFCVGLLNPCGPHPWREWWNEQESTARYSFAHSLFLFRKTLPGGSRDAALSTFVDTMTQGSPPPDPDFLAFIRQEVPRLFPKGWDSRYRDKVYSLTPPTSASIGHPRSSGGVRGGRSPISQAACSVAVGQLPPPDPSPAKVMAVPDGGKWRVVTVNGDEDLCLRPLHSLLYDHISGKPWLLRGDAKSRAFKDFSTLEGEVFVSGDYASATDSIPLSIYHEMLKSVALTSSEVPQSIWSFALRSSVKTFVDQNGQVLGVQGRGQLMGSYLSFPFLCLLNYLCFKFSIRRKVPLKINGDDIVFRCTLEEKERWVANVRRSGLVLSLGKTMVHPRFFTLNSQLFRATPVGVSAVTFFRSKAYFTCPETADAIAGQLQSLVVGSPGSNAKDEIQAAFLRRVTKKLHWSMMSLTRDLGARVSRKVLRPSGLYDREKFYLGLPPPRPPKGPVLPGAFRKVALSYGASRKKSQRIEEQLFFRELSEMTWLGWQPTSVRRGVSAYRRFKFRHPTRCGFIPCMGRWRGRNLHLVKPPDQRGERREELWCLPAFASSRAPLFLPEGTTG